ncbi:hypothetical protein JCM5350_004606 [Sporobolomyces pararoseus]
METQSRNMQLQSSERAHALDAQKLPGLPYELIKLVLELAYPEPHNLEPPLLSKAFLPVRRSIIHKTLIISSGGYLDKFNEQCERDSELGKLVKSLTDSAGIEFKGSGRWKRDPISWSGSSTTGIKEESANKLWHNLDNIRSVKLGSRYCRNLLLSDVVRSLAIPKLQRLVSLHVAVESTEGQLQLLDLLPRLPSLVSLHVEVETSGPFMSTSAIFPQIQHLSLVGDVFKEGMEPFYKSFPNISTLGLATGRHHPLGARPVPDPVLPAFSPGLEVLPPSIILLSIRKNPREPRIGFSSKQDYRNLKALRLEVGMIDSELASSMSNLPSLERVEIGKGGGHRPFDVVTSVENVMQHVPALTHLKVDTEEAAIGTRVAEGGSLPRDHGVLLVAPDWKVPEYDAMEKEALNDCFSRARERGIEVSGTTVESLRVLEEWREERARLVKLYLESPEGKRAHLNQDLVSIE